MGSEDGFRLSSGSEADGGGFGDLVFDTPPLRRRGRPKKKQRRLYCARRVPRKPRGRPKDSEVGICQAISGLVSECSEDRVSQATPVSACPSSPCGGYFTRAKKAWLLAKVAGMEFPGSDLEAIRGQEEEMKEAGPSCS